MKAIYSNQRDGSLTVINPELTRDLDWRDYLQAFVDELEMSCVALPTEQNINQRTNVELAWDIADCHHALSEVFRCTNEIRRSNQATPRLLAVVTSVIDRCIEVNIHIDWVTRNLLPLAILSPSSGAEQ